ncbi:f3c73c71-ba10-44dd-b416-81854bab44d0 [Thermothielavioides terrestris]|uniref:Small ribosomal subunit protein uS7m n=1 Tax=Thermothielavioides terrestris TaxID=2587410 RepID=A0A3S4CBY0_9PEZI|nr:f3c73c71-ba10-44dd-b416-81854bab44d0 [Thermothielavioides terrestris]
MPPRLNIWSACRALSTRARAFAHGPHSAPAVLARGLADNTASRFPGSSGGDGSNLPPSMTPASEPPAYSSEENRVALDQLRLIQYGINPLDPALEGHKFGLPELPLPPQKHIKHRYNEVVEQITRLLMRDGKLAKAQRDMAMILNYLRTQPPPKLDPARPLLPGAPPAHHLPLDPVLYFGLAIDSVAPLIKIRAFKKLAGGGRALEVPMPLRARQRRRIAFQWILDVVNKKKSMGSGRTMFPHRVAEEIVAVVEGRSPVWDRRMQVHKLGTANRANLNHSGVVGKI